MRARLLACAAAASLAAATLAAIPSARAATTRYASPTGSGSACTQAVPCSLLEAVTNAGDGDTVQLTADEYFMDAPLIVWANNLTIAGPQGRTDSSSFLAYILYRSQADGGVVPDTDPKILIQGQNVRFQRLAISGTSSGSATLVGAGVGVGTSYDRVRILNSGPSDTLVGEEVTLTNSVVRHTNAGNTGSAVAISGWVVGSTVYSENGTALYLDNAYHSAPYCGLTIRNTLALGGGSNLTVNDTNGGGARCGALPVDYDYSWIPAVAGPGVGGGITVVGSSVPAAGAHVLPDTPAVFNPGGSYLSDLVLPVGSPAINAGCTGGTCSTNDYYGRPRPIGTANDIGAMEQSLSPSATPVTVTDVTATRAGLTARVGPRGAATNYHLQYRRVGASSWTTAATGTIADNLFATRTVTAAARNLSPGARYQARVTTSNIRGTTNSASLTDFRATPPRLTVHRLKAKVSRRTVKVQTSATPSTTGRLIQTATTGTGSSRKVRCQTSATVTAPTRTALTCNLGKKVRKEVRRKALALRITTTLRPSSGSPVTQTTRLTVPRTR